MMPSAANPAKLRELAAECDLGFESVQTSIGPVRMRLPQVRDFLLAAADRIEELERRLGESKAILRDCEPHLPRMTHVRLDCEAFLNSEAKR